MRKKQSTPDNFAPYSLVGELFDAFDDTVFFIKDFEGRYIVCNNTLVSRCNCKTKEELLRRKPSDLLGLTLGQSYEAQDRSVMANDLTLKELLEVHIYGDLSIGWCLTTKHPLKNTNGEIFGLMGISKDLKPTDMQSEVFAQLSPAIEHVAHHLHAPPSITYLSAIIGLTRYQLDRRIQKVFGLTTGQWILQQRMDSAQQQLADTEASIVDIALSIGYADQSTFSRQFKKTVGLSPLAYRHLKGKISSRII